MKSLTRSKEPQMHCVTSDKDYLNFTAAGLMRRLRVFMSITSLPPGTSRVLDKK